MDDAAIVRRRLDDGRWRAGRLGADRATTLGIALYRVVTPPVSAPGIAICNPVALDAVEASGGSASVAADTDVQVPVVVLAVPAAGAKLACVLIDGSWVAIPGGSGPPCVCRVCITATGCGSAIAADIGIYPPAGCTGTPLATGHYDGVTEACFCLPASGLYYVQLTPTGGAEATYRPLCYLIDVTDEDCATEKDVAVSLPPYKYSVTIKVGGRPTPGPACDGDFLACYCGIPGATVRYQDTLNDVTATSDSNGYVGWPTLDTPAPGSPYTITVSGLDCGFDLPATFSGTVAFCPGIVRLVPLPAKSGFAYMSACTHPLPTTLYLDIYGATVTLGYVGYTSGHDIWEGCAGITCAHRATPTTCTFDEPMPAGEQFRYAIGSGTVYVKFRLYIAGVPDEFGSPCTSTVTYTLEVYGVTVPGSCDIFDHQLRLADKTWRWLGGDLNNPANWTQDTWDCSNVPSIGGVTVASDSGTWSSFCTCAGFSIPGSVSSADGIPCAADDYTLRF